MFFLLCEFNSPLKEWGGSSQSLNLGILMTRASDFSSLHSKKWCSFCLIFLEYLLLEPSQQATYAETWVCVGVWCFVSLNWGFSQRQHYPQDTWANKPLSDSSPRLEQPCRLPEWNWPTVLGCVIKWLLFYTFKVVCWTTVVTGALIKINSSSCDLDPIYFASLEISFICSFNK